ncbi:MAG: serine/threonine protein kinase [Planctomycetaceae bacterium]|jgi:serine/threonine protein kinase|nr:serine/threonine protein kinase [Planctomycetaceae bacterium]
MSDIVFTCECGKVYKFNRRFAGRTSRCIICKRDYVVPLISEHINQINQINQTVLKEESPEDFTISSLLPSSTDDSYHDLLSNHSSDPSLFSPSVSVSVSSKKPSDSAESEQIGKYEIREKIGSGGMGHIFYAWDTQLQRNVTIKTLNKKSRQHEHYKERFINEARITGKLIHSGIIPIYSFDYDTQGEPYYVMRFLEGQTFEQLITQYHNLKGFSHTLEELRRLIRHFIDVCQTIAYAHDHHVVHRDIKPSNIMLSGYGETIVLDWGLAKILTTEKNDEFDPDHFENDLETDEKTIDLTLASGRVGTLGFQSPEYLRDGQSQPSDDIYALGVTLYYLLCNKLPYKLSRDHRGVFDRLMIPPRLPHWDNSHVSRSLSAICLCALSFDKTKRYSSAAHLAADLQCWLDGNAVSVYRMNWKEKIEFLVKKNIPLLGTALAAFSFGIILTRLFFGR